MNATPLENILGLSLLRPAPRLIAEAILLGALVALPQLMRRLGTFRSAGFLMCAIGLALDLTATPAAVQWMEWPRWTAALGLIVFTWGLIRLLLDGADYAAHRSRTHFSTIFKDILMFAMYGIVVMAVLHVDFHVDPTPLLASTAVVAVVAGLALQESLGNIFSGLTLQLSKPFTPGDWVRSGLHVGRIQGIGWRSTAMITRANEKLEIPNASLAKEVLINYSNGAVADEFSVSLSYDAPPNFVRQTVSECLRDIPGVLRNPPVEVLATDYQDSGIRYRVKYWMANYSDADRLHDAVASSLWYALRRRAIEIPYPVRTLRMGPVPAARAAETEIVAELRQVDFLHDLREEELRMLLQGVTLLAFGAGEVVMREGDQGDSLYIIRTGTVEVVAAASDGQQVHIRDLERPAFFGEMALMTGEPRNATVRACTDAELLELGRAGFIQLFKAHPETAAQMGQVIARRMSERRELLAAAPHEDGAVTRANWLLSKMRAVFNLSPMH
jgi:small-conductance mechanosensitive channel